MGLVLRVAPLLFSVTLLLLIFTLSYFQPDLPWWQQSVIAAMASWLFWDLVPIAWKRLGG
jgi:hypothetical protein